MSYFPKAYSRSKNKIKVKLDFPDYATRPGLRNADTSDFHKKVDLANFKIRY